MSRLPVVPISFSTSSSTGRPWQSQPPLRGDVVSGHRLEARVDVLERARLDVVHAGLAVRGGRALVEDPERAHRARWSSERAKTSASFQNARMPRSSSGKLTFGSTGSNRVISVPPSPVRTCKTPRPIGAGTRRGPRGTTPLAAVLDGPRPLIGRRHGLPRSRAGPACAYCGRGRSASGSGRGSGRMVAGGSAPGSHRPRLALAPRSPRSCSRRRLFGRCYTRWRRASPCA